VAAFSIHSQLPSTAGGRSSIHNNRSRHGVVTVTHLTWRKYPGRSIEIYILQRIPELLMNDNQDDKQVFINTVVVKLQITYSLAPAKE
jgi:hypothetical protein